MKPGLTLYTIGHSTRSAAELLALLGEFGVQTLVDVRRYPASRRHPHFAREPLASALAREGIAYEHAPELGGRRRPRRDSPNTAWRQAGFRGYADHMATSEFETALDRLLERAVRSRVALMCAEAVPWKCHRQLLADALVARRHRVLHVVGTESAHEHALSPNARPLPGGGLVYPAAADAQRPLFRTSPRRPGRSGRSGPGEPGHNR